MLSYLLSRLGTGLITLFGITVITFLVIRLMPGDQTLLDPGYDGETLTEEDVARLRAWYGLDRPLHEQYLSWVGRVVRADFGESFHDQRPVGKKIAERLWPTLSVALISLIAATLISIPIGLWSAARRGGRVDRIGGVLLYGLYSVPSYVGGVLLILVFGVHWKILPISGMQSENADQLGSIERGIDSAKHYVLIVICSTYASLAYFSRFVRQNTLEVAREQFILTARAKGASGPRVWFVHAFRNTLVPLVTLLALTLPFLLSGSVILEKLFDWPGLGQLYITSVHQRDYPTLMALNLVTAVLVLLMSILADLAYALVDPRISFEGSR